MYYQRDFKTVRDLLDRQKQLREELAALDPVLREAIGRMEDHANGFVHDVLVCSTCAEVNTVADRALVKSARVRAPHLGVGDMVVIRFDPTVRAEYEARVQRARRLLDGQCGKITDRSDAHGLCFEVTTPHGGIAWYEPSELERVDA